jgi:hypothetical protein
VASNQLIEDDIGLNSYEEVNIIHKGLNYGYSEREGVEAMTNGITGSQQGMLFPTNSDFLSTTGLVAQFTPRYPAAAYSSRDGDAVSSGFVYRGAGVPQLQGKYVFGDITTARLFYCDYTELLAADDTNRLSLATIRELQVMFDSPFDSPDLGLQKRRLFDVVADTYTNRGGFVAGQRITGTAANTAGNDIDGVAYGKGRADIRFAVGDDNELYVISKSDGMIRKIATANWQPVAGTNTFTRAPNAVLNLAVSDLLANCFDGDGDPLTFVSVAASTNGLALTNNGGIITYSNAANVTDRFTYTITDGRPGVVVTGTVIVQVVQPSSTNSIIAMQYGSPSVNNFSMTLSGMPGYTYILQYATNLPGQPWVNFATNVADTNGLWTVVDVAATNATRFYRAVSQ